MTFRVVWQPVARDSLAEFWLQSNSEVRRLIGQAANKIDQLLSNDPLSEGESRPGGRRIMFVPLLAVVFHVDQSANTVYVLSVWPIRPRRQ
jgi:hypothetical protein